MTSGANHILTSGGKDNLMRHYGFQRRGRVRSAPRPRIQHSPASMGNTILTNDQLITFFGVAAVTAGSSASSTRTDSDRATGLSSGSKIGTVTIDVGATLISEEGYIEYMVFKAQRQDVTPVKGTFPIPSDGEVIAGGLQQTYRMNMPGWCIKYGQIPMSSQTPRTFKIRVNFAKFKMATVRDGDFFGLTLFNRSGASITLDWQARYWETK